MPINKFLQQLDNYTKNYKSNYVIDWSKMSQQDWNKFNETYNQPKVFITPPEWENDDIAIDYYNSNPINIKSNTNNRSLQYKIFGKETVLTDKYLDFVKSLENSVKRGYNPETGMWKAYNSPEGGGKTLGYGTKIGSKSHPLYNDVKLGKEFTDKEVHDIMYQDLDKAYDNTRKWFAENYDTLAFDTIQPQIKQALVYKQYHSRGGIGSYPKFAEGAVKGDLEQMKRENASYFKKNGKWYRTAASERLEDLLYYKHYE